MKPKSHTSDFRKILDRITHRHDIRRVFDAFVRLAACALACQTRKEVAFINTTLWGIPTRVMHGNALSNEYWAALVDYPLHRAVAAARAPHQMTRSSNAR